MTKVRKVFDSLSVTTLFFDLPIKNIAFHFPLHFNVGETFIKSPHKSLNRMETLLT